MKKSAIALLLFPFMLSAQQQSAPDMPRTQQAYERIGAMEKEVPTADYSHMQIPAGEDALPERVSVYFTEHLPALKDASVSLRLIQYKQSRIGWHLEYEQLFAGIPVYGASLKVNVNKEGVTLSVFDQLVSTTGWKASAFVPDASLGKPVWIPLENAPLAAYTRYDGYDRVISDARGTQIHRKDARLYFANEDTTVTGKVFLPDPLSSQQVIYGKDGTYQHFNDSDYALLNNARADVSFPATLEGGVFTLKNDYAVIVDRMSPTVVPAISPTGVFEFTRRQDGFKDVMAFYHVYTAQKYFRYLGFNDMEGFRIKVDAHAGTGDNSFFEFSSDSSLNLGTGGVPDAEDGDVITHEYTHAMSWFINASPNMGTERRAIDEAICDVIAAIMSHKYTTFNWRLLFNFDAPNPVTPGVSRFWSGRNGNSPKTYASKVGDWYSDSEIWSSTVLDIAEEIGHDSAAILMLTALYSLPQNGTMPQAAELFMQADSAVFHKYFGWRIGGIFNTRGLGNFPTALDEPAVLKRSVKLLNSAAFASGEGNAVLELPGDVSVTVFDIGGKTLGTFRAAKGSVEFDPAQYAPGMYIIRVASQGAQVSIKMIRN
jgi:hypothetical protein